MINLTGTCMKLLELSPLGDDLSKWNHLPLGKIYFFIYSFIQENLSPHTWVPKSWEIYQILSFQGLLKTKSFGKATGVPAFLRVRKPSLKWGIWSPMFKKVPFSGHTSTTALDSYSPLCFSLFSFLVFFWLGTRRPAVKSLTLNPFDSGWRCYWHITSLYGIPLLLHYSKYPFDGMLIILGGVLLSDS